MKSVNHLRALIVMLLLAFTSQSVSAIAMPCDIPADRVQASTTACPDMNNASHELMSMDASAGETQPHCPDCDCPMGGCSLLVPSEAISCGPPRPQMLNPEYPEFPEFEQVSLLLRPPITR